MTAASRDTLERALAAASSDRPASGVVSEFLRARMPIHFGGMSDPFQPAEAKFGVSLAYLDVLRKYNYPTVISTRSPLIANELYMRLLKEMNVLVQFSLSTISDSQARRFEPLAPKPSAVLATMAQIAQAGIRVSARWQPYASQISCSALEMVSAVSAAGARHLSLEHLKISTELHSSFSAGESLDHIREFYRRNGAIRDGREFVLPAEHKLPTVLEVRDLCHLYGMTFGAGDNDLQFLSDGDACCSGVDLAAGFDNYYQYTVTNIVKRGIRLGSRIRLQDYGVWRPMGSVDRFLNSKSRLGGRLGRSERGVEPFLRYRWNNTGSSSSPARMYGISNLGEKDCSGNEVYHASGEIVRLMESSLQK